MPSNDRAPEGADEPPDPKHCPIVGVGASAGGLAATSELLRQLGAQPGISLVILHHLDPHHESSLVEILSRVAQLKVEVACTGARIAPNRVYVTPPNSGLTIEHGVLQLAPRVEIASGLHLPIDNFFVSLAKDLQECAIGVLLSGTGTDGSQGIIAIKLAGGTTYVQDATAEFPSMPESALATGYVDHVMSPAEIARQLRLLGEQASAFDTAEDGPTLPRILARVRAATGVDFSNYKQRMVHRRVQRRALAHGQLNLRDYASMLDADPAEAAALCAEVLIHVTSFFRDPAVFEALRTTVYPKLLAGPPRKTGIRVWVPGCSTGEEVYSIAMSLMEYVAENDADAVAVTLFGTDVSASAIEKARAGKFDASIEQDVSEARLQRFFSKLADGYQIRREVRERCVFAKHDATRDPPFFTLDMISCRNLMIYFNTALQERLLPIFHYALRDPGFLVLGASETTRQYPGFAALDSKNKLYGRTSTAPRLSFSFSDPQPPLPSGLSGLASRKSWSSADVHREADRLVLAEFAPPGVVVSDDLSIVQFRGRTGPFLEPLPGAASFDLLRMVREELRLPLRQLIDEARTKLTRTCKKSLRLGVGETARKLDLEVIPFGRAHSAQQYFVILFKESLVEPAASQAGVLLEPETPNEQLAQELASTRAYLQTVIEQFGTSNEELRVANEEIISSNEELRSTNDELQMAKEELQATNEELRTLNDDMNVRNVEKGCLNDDLLNILSSVEIPIVIVGRDLRVRRFTPAAGRMLSLSADDLGRALTDLKTSLGVPNLVQVITDVFEQLVPVIRSVRDRDGRVYQLAVRPYLTADKRVDGTVISVFDVGEATRGASLLAHAYAETVVDTVTECLALVDLELRVLSTNRAFQQTFELSEAALEGRLFYELEKNALDIQDLHASLRALQPGEKLEGFRVESALDTVQHRTFLLNARRIEQRDALLLALRDVTATQRAEKAVQQVEHGFREMLMNAAQAVTMTDSRGAIVFANHVAADTFGYSITELTALNCDALLPERVRADHSELRASFLRSPHHRDSHRNLKTWGLRKDGSEFPTVVSFSSMLSVGKPLLVSFITDVSLQHVAERQIRHYQAQLQRMVFDAAITEERERRRIAGDLHDGIGQALALAQIKLTGIRDAAAEPKRPQIDEVIELLAQSVLDIRTLTFELSPPMLYDLGLKDALSWLAEQVEKRQGLHIELTDDDAPKVLDESTAALVYRAVRELIMNVFKHSRSASAKVSLRRNQDDLEIDVVDAGVGFAAADASSQSSASGFGLFNVREQISRLGGTVTVESALGRGTRVSLRVPMRQPS